MITIALPKKRYKKNNHYNDAENAYNLLYQNPNHSLTHNETAWATKILLSVTDYESIVLDIPLDSRIQAILQHDNLPSGMIERILFTLNDETLIDNFNGLTQQLLTHPQFSKDNYLTLISRIKENYPLFEELRKATNKALQHVGHLLTYKPVRFKFLKPRKTRFVIQNLTVNYKEHQQHQTTYRVLEHGLYLLERKMGQLRLG